MTKKPRAICRAFISATLGVSLLLGCCGAYPAGAAARTAETAAGEQDLTQYIDMAIGAVSDNGSNTVYGPQRPNASVNPSPDTNPQNGCTGYKADGQIRGFSQIHVSGTGVGKYGQFLISPQVGLSTRLDGHDSGKADETSTCAEYSVNLTRYDIDVAFTPAEHSTIYKFTYPAADQAGLLIDLAHNITDVNATDVQCQIQTRAGQTIITGQGYYPGGQGPGFHPGGWGEGHSLYFYAVVDRAADVTGVYDAAGAQPGAESLGPVNVSDRLAGMGAYMSFDTEADDQVLLKIGVSFKSVDQAREWLEAEIPDWDYDAVKEETLRQWNEELQKIVIGGDVPEAEKRLFYTAMYHSHVMPRDRTGDFEAYGDADMIDDHFALWDTWRTLYPLYSITNPDLVAKTVNSFIARAGVNGSVRDSFVAGKDMPAQQGGDNIDNVIADAYVKGIEGIDWDGAYAVLKQSADQHRLDWQGWDQTQPGDSHYKDLGWIPGDDRSIGVSTCSYLLEYAYNDYCAAQVAKGMGDEESYEKWLARSGNWQNIWNPGIENNGYTGFIWPRSADGEWITDSSMRDPTSWQGSWSAYFYEGSSWNYSFFVPHDVPTLIEKMGGEDTFCERLTLGLERGWVDFSNEPAFLAPYLFSYTDKPYLTADAVNQLRTRFNENGVPGNDDSGAMSSWYIFSSMGFFPNAGQDLYYFTSPHYPEVTINMDSGRSLRLIAHDLSEENRYIQSITVNGQPYRSTMFTHDMITDGGVIEFQMGSQPVNYAAEAGAQIASVTDIGAEVVDLDQGADEWAYFASPEEICRPAAQHDAALAPEGLLTHDHMVATWQLDQAYGGFSWADGAPTASADGARSYVRSSGGIEIPIRLSQGARLELYVLCPFRGRLTISDGDGQQLVQTELAGEFQKVTIDLDCGRPETFTVLFGPPMDGLPGDSVGLAAARLSYLSTCAVSFDTMGGGVLPGLRLRQGDPVPEPEDPEREGYTFGGWYADDGLTIPWNFEEDTVEGDTTLYAKWTAVPGVFVESIRLPADNTVVDLSGYDDWMHFGDQTVPVIHTDRKDLPDDQRVFGDIVSVNGNREENERNDGQPFAFTWSDGTPVKSMTQPNRYFSWARDGLELPLTLPAGQSRVDLYLSGIRSRGTIEIQDAAGATVLPARELWGNTGETRQYRVVSLRFHSDQAARYTIRLLVDLNDTEPENYSMAIAAATYTHPAVYDLTARADAGGDVSVRGGGAKEAGQTVTVTARPDPGYQFAGWEVDRGSPLELDRPLENPLVFTMPQGDVSLRATFTKEVVAVQGLERIPYLSMIRLDDPAYMDWAYLGRSEGMVTKADGPGVFASPVTASSGSLTYEDMNSTNPNSPYFYWTGGAPVETGEKVRNIVWNGDGMRFDLRLPQGRYEATLYISGVQAGAIMEVLDERDNLLLDYKLWDSMGDYRPYRKLTLSFDCETPRTFTLHLRVNPADITADWQSVSLYAATVTDVTPHAHDYGDQWQFDGESHWLTCDCGQRAQQAPHTFGADGHTCTVCGYQEEEPLRLGDLDKDGEVTIADVMEACKVMAREAAGTDPTDEEIARGDLDGDREITIADVMEICKILARRG